MAEQNQLNTAKALAIGDMIGECAKKEQGYACPLNRIEFLKQRNNELARSIFNIGMDYAKKRDFSREMVRNFDEIIDLIQGEEHQRISSMSRSTLDGFSQPRGCH